METLETPETTIIVEAPDPLDSGEIRKLVSEFRKEGKNFFSNDCPDIDNCELKVGDKRFKEGDQNRTG